MKFKEKLIFVNGIPLIMPELNVQRQLKIEIWLEPDLLLKAVGISKLEQIQKESKPEPISYIV